MFLFKIIRKSISALLLLLLVIPLFLLGRVWMVAHNPDTAKADVIVVLGAAQFDGRPSDALKARLIQAESIYHLGLARKIITVGSGAPGDRTTEAASGKAWLALHGVKASSVLAVPKGRDTLSSTQSYAEKMKELKFQSAILVTDPYHCLRAITMAQDQGIRASCSPVLTGPNSLVHSNMRYLVREAGAYLAYLTLGRHGIHISDRLNQ